MNKETMPPQLGGMEGPWPELTVKEWMAQEKDVDSPSLGERLANTKAGTQRTPGEALGTASR